MIPTSSLNIQNCIDSIKLNPESKDLYFQLSQSLLSQGKAKEAFQACIKGLDYGEADGNLLRTLATSVADKGLVTEAIDLCCLLLSRQPDDSLTLQKLGYILESVGEHSESTALQEISQIVDQANKPAIANHQLETYMTLGVSLERQSRLLEAANAYQSALRLAPDSSEIHTRLERVSAQSEFRHYSRAARRLTESEAQEYLRVLDQDGFVVIPNYYDPDYCQELRQKLEAIVTTEETNTDLPGGAYLRHNRVRQTSTDTGVSRIYHVNRLLPELNSHKLDPAIGWLISSYAGRAMYSKNLWYQYNLPAKDTRGFHADMFALRFQVKSIVYLQDTSIEDGPFCYIKGSHRDLDLLRAKFHSTNPPGQDTSYTSEDVAHLLHNIMPVEALAGSLLLADVGAPHRGLPQRSRSRSILMQYFMDTPGDTEDERQ